MWGIEADAVASINGREREVVGSRFTKGGSSPFLKALKTGSRSSRRSVSTLVPLLEELRDGPRRIDDLSSRIPMGERIVYELVSDGMIERDVDSDGEVVVKLTEQGLEFLKRRPLTY